MNYRKLLEDYQQNKLNEEQKASVEADIDRQEAISDYLFDRDRADFGEDGIGGLPPEPLDEQSKEFVKLIDRAIHRTLMKIGMTAAILVTVIFLVLPLLFGLLFYNPAAKVGFETNRLSRDWAIWSEVNMPGNIADYAEVRREGAGRYSFTLHQSVSHVFSTPIREYAGRIDRGHLTLYTPDALRKPSFTLFANVQLDPNKPVSKQEHKACFSWTESSVEEAWETIEGLDPSAEYNAYISLEKPVSLSKARKILKKLDVPIGWYAVQTAENDYSSTVVGMQSDFEGTPLDWYDEEYPWLFLLRKNTKEITNDETSFYNQDDIPFFWEFKLLKWFGLAKDVSFETDKDLCRDEEIMATHFVSMLRYLDERIRFRSMVGDYEPYNEGLYAQFADYVEEYGLHIYGIMVTAHRDELLQLKNDDRVYGITIEPVS